ncbi:MAG: 16S rRNA (guanine(527)-N(7))-methyltransferase RsmG [Acutalibacteraceae bacterium]
MIETLKKYAADYGFKISDDLAEKLKIYGTLLKEWNEKINLTAITDDEGIAIKHFLDCLLITKVGDFKAGQKVIDVGTGAGFPGLVIAAAFPETSVTLLDSTGKKLKAVEDIANNMGLENVTAVNARAEEMGKKEEFREQFDFATARAVAELRVLAEYTLPFVKKGGKLLSMKGAVAGDEAQSGKHAVSVLGGSIKAVHEFTLPNGDKRAVIEVNKISQTSAKYPRPSAQISKKPL